VAVILGWADHLRLPPEVHREGEHAGEEIMSIGERVGAAIGITLAILSIMGLYVLFRVRPWHNTR